MKTRDFELLIKTGGIENVYIEDERDGNFSIFLRLNDPVGFRLDREDLYIKTAVGHRRKWRNLGRLYKFIRESGWVNDVEILLGPKKIKFVKKS